MYNSTLLHVALVGNGSENINKQADLNCIRIISVETILDNHDYVE